MHENSRHATHVLEVLLVTIETMKGIQGQQKAIHEILSSGPAKPDQEQEQEQEQAQEQAQEYMSFQLQMVEGLKERSISNHARLQNEITLVINSLTGFLLSTYILAIKAYKCRYIILSLRRITRW